MAILSGNGAMSSNVSRPATVTTIVLKMNSARSSATDVILPAREIVEFRNETRSVSPNACPNIPNCPAASDARRSPRSRANET